ncbi:hypothetical protein B0T26DRAFT_671110 [Lasiosphaeria miniovina]|uniref:C3H1-type domain-containing protein n=1 Tax=Lasiosphaeria miniovina TaxID=1954250 RepID=A0AA40BIL9_9PEZI|nr:uncharacterized protein B0T26DRAFT_671110 [Lasiosphaeria miniovina]KAK0734882.1 hypothetical protein B0T26DRAFT_671110 [Lasiosphaeria miniovina]
MAPQPRHFVVRPNVRIRSDEGGAIRVPLIAVDELPEWLDIVGVPRSLTRSQTNNMEYLGTFTKSKGKYNVNYNVRYVSGTSPGTGLTGTASSSRQADGSRDDRNAARRLAAAPQVQEDEQKSTAHVQAAALALVEAPTTTGVHPTDRMKAHYSALHARDVAGLEVGAGPLLAPLPGLSASRHAPATGLVAQYAVPQAPPAQSPSTTDTATGASNFTPAASSADTSPLNINSGPGPIDTNSFASSSSTVSEDEYCRNYCRYGRCKWKEKCWYKHEMPITMSGLVEVGLVELPQWFMLATEGNLGASSAGGRAVGAAGPAAGSNVTDDHRPAQIDQQLAAGHPRPSREALGLELERRRSQESKRIQRRSENMFRLATSSADRNARKKQQQQQQQQQSRKAREKTPRSKGGSSAAQHPTAELAHILTLQQQRLGMLIAREEELRSQLVGNGGHGVVLGEAVGSPESGALRVQQVTQDDPPIPVLLAPRDRPAAAAVAAVAVAAVTDDASVANNAGRPASVVLQQQQCQQQQQYQQRQEQSGQKTVPSPMPRIVPPSVPLPTVVPMERLIDL